MLRSALHNTTGEIHIIEIESSDLSEYTIIPNAGEGNRNTPSDGNGLSTHDDEEAIQSQRVEIAVEKARIEKAVIENKRRKGELTSE
jgi:hypothetical protein